MSLDRSRIIEARDARRVCTLSDPADQDAVEPTAGEFAPPGLPAGPQAEVYGSEDSIRDAAGMVAPIGLADLVESAELLTRVDRKYFVPARIFRRLIAELGSLRVLEIDGQRTFDYESVYFDTPDLLTYRAHLQRRRRRFKARTRTYIDSGLCMFEVKTVGLRGATVKDRIKHAIEDRAVLTEQAHEFLAQTLMRTYGQPVPPGLQPMLINLYRRTTFTSLDEGSRLTCDVALSCHTPHASMTDSGTHVLVESKSANGMGRADQMLLRLGVRPASVSKYGLGIAALHPEVPNNPWHAALKRYFDEPVVDY
ncbi:MAG TPA: polyphosphate polymerase domain-containing protein [Pseudonocardia sp.]|nr:polyphosphate polymerase domain-containing protein [Pseudonocardia sp.]